ncbi:hypothetical protein R1flu_012788 [Riccia fluitans]|uniref:Uncharacterized protein n=1 Tax=Riccia fluitans TaxID=41844 RepID=A0ABD1ZBM3_9MARC
MSELAHKIGHQERHSEKSDGDIGQIHAMQISLLAALPFAVKAVIRLGVPDILNDVAPQVQLTADEIATRIAAPSGKAADPENLDRLLRLLASHNLLTTTVSGTERRYGLTPASGLKYLASNEGRSLASLLLLNTSPEYFSPYEFLHETVLDPSLDPLRRAYGVGVFEFIEKDRALGSLFNKAMAGSSALVMSSLLQEYKGFEGLKSLVDVGGGTGVNLALILSKYPHLRGINFDLPHVVNKGLQVRGLEHVGGSFFESCPQGDAAFMKWILHDWSDNDCVRILKNIAKALPPDGKLINVDVLVPEELVVDTSIKSQSGFLMDVIMLTYANGGRERNLNQFRKIGLAAGFSRVEIAASLVNQTVLEFCKN